MKALFIFVNKVENILIGRNIIHLNILRENDVLAIKSIDIGS